ncbi:hypothetical protein BZA77DRAFT_290061 [Pyronema omphalodes]|nr:hypothetical protein BZA77DRAFT_290061 [Pyronema omphalodes]
MQLIPLLLALLPLTAAVRSGHTIATPSDSSLGQAPGGGRYGFKRCVDKGIRPNRISCLNFDSIKTSPKTALGPAPKDPLQFSTQFSVFNLTRGAELNILPSSNKHSYASSPNSLILSRFTPETRGEVKPTRGHRVKVDKAAGYPTISRPDGGEFDLFGFYMQPMEIPEGVRGVDVWVTAYKATSTPTSSKREPDFDWMITFLPSINEMWYFEIYEVTGEKWDNLKEVKIWAQLAGVEDADWELFVDDVWLRWGEDKHRHSVELK